MGRKGQFKKGGGRVGSGHAKKRHSSHAMSHSPRTVTKTKYVTRAPAKKHHRSRGKSGGGGIKLVHLGIAAAALGYVTSDKNGVAFIRENGAKIPGAATFGTPAAIGLAALAVDRFVKPNKWLRLLGYAGIVVASIKFGSDGTDFKFVGDESGDYDVGDESAGDVDD